jgi:3-deoxy-D-manno-octulosonate 8-phosphate phosphatase (KDO 8-P phosphatase)
MTPNPSVTQRCRKIRCLLADVDGVLTDGKLHFTSDGQESKTFDVQDGHGIAMAQRAGLMIGFISGRPSKATDRRAADLGVKILKQAATNKMEMVDEVKREQGLSDEEISFVGDELVDLPVLRRVGLAIAVPNAMDEVKEVAHYITTHRGGDGAVREVIEMILKTQGSWQKVIAKYMAMLLSALLCLGAGARAATNDTASGYIERFEVPERDDDGNLRWKLGGDKALIRPDGLMNIFNVRAEFYASNKVDMVFTTSVCLLDRANKRATTDAPVKIERGNMIVTGIGADWTDTNSCFVVRSNVRVIMTAGTDILPGGPQ